MTRVIVAGLIVLNVLLGVGVYLRLGGEQSAQAQIGGGGGDFAVVAGNNAGQSIVYIMEAQQGHLIALRTDPINHRVTPAGLRVVANDLKNPNVNW